MADSQYNDDFDNAVVTRPRKNKKSAPPQISPFFEEDEYSLEEYEQMLGMYEQTLSNIEEGEIVKARVLRITENAVILDVEHQTLAALGADAQL